MSDTESSGCSVVCTIVNICPIDKPTHENMTDWLQDDSGLSEEYFEKITQVEYNSADGEFTISFDETANCLVAMNQINERTVCGRYGEYGIVLSCPRGGLRTVRLTPDPKSKLMLKEDILAAMKTYGEIIEIQTVNWHDSGDDDGGNDIWTGQVDVSMFLQKTFAGCIKIANLYVKTRVMAYELYDDDILKLLWDNCVKRKTVRYTGKMFGMIDKLPGCRTVCKINEINLNNDSDCNNEGIGHQDMPCRRDVYEWLIMESGLNDRDLKRILAFRRISEDEYHIVYKANNNCLTRIREITNRTVCNSYGIEYRMDVHCAKGVLTDVTLIARDGRKCELTKEIVEDFLWPRYGKLLMTGDADNEGLRTSTRFDSSGKIMKEFACKMMLLTKTLPATVMVKGIEMCAIVVNRSLEELDRNELLTIWNEMNETTRGGIEKSVNKKDAGISVMKSNENLLNAYANATVTETGDSST